MALSERERMAYVSIVAGACMGKMTLVECTEKETGKRVLALITPDPDNPQDGVVFCTMSAEDIHASLEPINGGEQLAMTSSPMFVPGDQPCEVMGIDMSEVKKPLVN